MNINNYQKNTLKALFKGDKQRFKINKNQFKKYKIRIKTLLVNWRRYFLFPSFAMAKIFLDSIR